MKPKVTLEDGTHERFDRSKIFKSLTTVGMDPHSARMISEQIEPHPGITEHEIKVKVFRLLDDIDPAVSERYLRTKKVYIRTESLDAPGHVMVPRAVLEYLEIKSGDKVDIIHCDRNCTLRAHEMEDRDHSHNTVLLSHYDMEKMGLKNKTMIAICKHHDA